MLTDAERREIDRTLADYPHPQAASVEALKIVQEARGWVSDEALTDLAAHLGVAPEALEGVATFYNLIFRRPVGRTVLLLCDSITCWMLGCDALRGALADRLGIGMGETTQDGRFTLLPVPCLGACDGAPAMMAGNTLHRAVRAEQLDGILGDCR